MNPILVESINELRLMTDVNSVIAGAVEVSFLNIFQILENLPHNLFWSDNDLENIVNNISDEILYLKEIILSVTLDLAVKIRRLFIKTLNEMILVAEKLEEYECAANLLIFKKWWIANFKTK